MSFSLELNESKHHLELSITGQLTGDVMKQIAAKGHELGREARKQFGHSSMLVDIAKVEGVEPEARAVAASEISAVGFDRVAVLGKHGAIGSIAEFIVAVTGRGDRVKFFDARDAAEDWLAQG